MRRRALILIIIGAILLALAALHTERTDNRPVRHSTGGLAVWEI
jgi:hypothetical protein